MRTYREQHAWPRHIAIRGSGSGWATDSLQKQPKRRALGIPAAHPQTCISPVIAGERMSFSHAMRPGFPAGVVRPADLAGLRDRIRQIEQPARHGVLPFDVAAIDSVLPGGGLAHGAVHEILGAGGDEEDGAAAAGFAAGILARLSPQLSPTSPRPSPPPGAERGMRRRLDFPSPPFRGAREGPAATPGEG